MTVQKYNFVFLLLLVTSLSIQTIQLFSNESGDQPHPKQTQAVDQQSIKLVEDIKTSLQLIEDDLAKIKASNNNLSSRTHYSQDEISHIIQNAVSNLIINKVQDNSATHTTNSSNHTSKEKPLTSHAVNPIVSEEQKIESVQTIDNIIELATSGGSWDPDYNRQIFEHSANLDTEARKNILDRLLSLINSQTLGESAVDIDLSF